MIGWLLGFGYAVVFLVVWRVVYVRIYRADTQGRRLGYRARQGISEAAGGLAFILALVWPVTSAVFVLAYLISPLVGWVTRPPKECNFKGGNDVE